MSILFVLIPLGLLLLGLAIWGFIWAVNHDQFDELDRAAHSILLDDAPRASSASGASSASSASENTEKSENSDEESR
jgi:cbb3-type cytochrome oxidase maturation protein